VSRPFAALGLFLALAALEIPAPSARAADARAIYRIVPGKAANVARLLSLGFDPAGHGPGSSIDFILTADEVARARAHGFTPIPVETSRGGPLSAPAAPGLGAYHTFAETVSEMTAYAAAHPSIARLDTVGMSLEGRPLLAIEISDHPGVDEGEPEVLLDGCHHARELMSVELPLDAMRRLLDGYGVDPLLTALVDSRHIWILPIVNPDGYVWVESHSGGQSSNWWRKNRRPNGDGTIGVDLNRNYGIQWGYDDTGSSPVGSSETYRGAAPFSEPETAALRDFVASRSFTIAVSFHSYGDLVLYPWGYDRLDTPDHSVFFALGDSVSRQNGYRAGNPKSNAIYLTNGGSDDWLYGDNVLKPPVLGFTIELNSSLEGFDPPENLIGPTCASNWGAVLTFLRYADQPRRVLGPARPASPNVTVGSGSTVTLAWSYPAPDPFNLPARHDVRRIAQVLRVTDDAEAGPADWDSVRFAWSTARSSSATHSYWSGSADSRESLLTSRASLDVVSNDSLVLWAWWNLESGFDYWYAQASTDGGGTWTSLAGTHTTNLNPSGQNEGFGVTGSSGGFVRTSFSLLPFIGRQAMIRFRCVTDGAVHNEGLYLDDIQATARYAGVSVEDTESSDTSFVIQPVPTQPLWLQVRGVDAEGQPSAWSDRAHYSNTVAAVPTAAGAVWADRIHGIAPNPANPSATVRFTLASGPPSSWRVDCFDASGRWLARLAEARDGGSGGERTVLWNGRDRAGRDLPSGVYFIRLLHGGARRTAKVALIR